MNLLLALTVSVLFGTGTFLLLKHDLLRMVAGVIMISNAVNLFILSVGLSRGAAPIYPLPEDAPVSDPLVQAMALTAIVISFGLTALLLAIVYRVYTQYGDLDGRDEGEQAGRPAGDGTPPSRPVGADPGRQWGGR